MQPHALKNQAQEETLLQAMVEFSLIHLIA